MNRDDDVKDGFSTRAIHLGHDPYAGAGGVTPPIHVSSTYAFPTAEMGQASFAGESDHFIYSRLGNPTLALLESRIASLEGGEAAVVTSSGMGAISALLWTLLRPGDTLITDKTLYGCTFSFFHHGLAEFGINVIHLDLQDPESLDAIRTSGATGVYFESPTNPNMRVVDIASVSQAAHAGGMWVAVDNTYLTPYLQRPLELGADYVIHSATKYLSGHGDLLAGAIVGTRDAMANVRQKGLKDFTGACLSAFDAHLILRGIKTLAVRMERHCQSAQIVAEWLQSHPAVRRVLYPGLTTDPRFPISSRQTTGFGGVLAFELDEQVCGQGIEAAQRFLNGLNLFIRAVSLGDCESLAQHPATMTHSTYTPDERMAHDISDSLIRLSIGLEDVEDLLRDLESALRLAMRGQSGRSHVA